MFFDFLIKQNKKHLSYRWFSLYVTAAMLVRTYKRISMNFFCYVHQHSRRGLCHLSSTGLKVL